MSALPSIDIDRPVGKIAPEAWAALIRANDPPRLFVQRNKIFAIDLDENGIPRVRAVTSARLKYELIRCATWWKWSRRHDRSFECDPPASVVRDMLADPAKPLPPLPTLPPRAPRTR